MLNSFSRTDTIYESVGRVGGWPVARKRRNLRNTLVAFLAGVVSALAATPVLREDPLAHLRSTKHDEHFYLASSQQSSNCRRRSVANRLIGRKLDRDTRAAVPKIASALLSSGHYQRVNDVHIAAHWLGRRVRVRGKITLESVYPDVSLVVQPSRRFAPRCGKNDLVHPNQPSRSPL